MSTVWLSGRRPKKLGEGQGAASVASVRWPSGATASLLLPARVMRKRTRTMSRSVSHPGAIAAFSDDKPLPVADVQSAFWPSMSTPSPSTECALLRPISTRAADQSVCRLSAASSRSALVGNSAVTSSVAV